MAQANIALRGGKMAVKRIVKMDHKNTMQKDVQKKAHGHIQHEHTQHAHKHEQQRIGRGMSTTAKSIIAIAAIILLSVIIAYSSRFFSSDGEIAAIVNGEKITSAELDEAYSRVPEEQRAVITKEMILNETLIPTMLLLQEAEKQSIKLSDKEAEDALEEFFNASGMTNEEFDAQLQEANMSYSKFMDFYAERLILVKLLNKTVKIPEVTDAEAKEFFYENMKSFNLGNYTMEFDDIKEEIRSMLASQKQQEAIQTYINKLREDSDVKIYTSNIDSMPQLTAQPGTASKDGSAFSETSDQVCYEGGKPIVRLYSTTWCPHCKWIAKTFDSVAKEYADEGKIIAHHWEVDTNDDTLTEEIEDSMPDAEMLAYREYGNGGVPMFVFGCRYVRIGNGYEAQGDLEAEEKEFRSIIESLLSQ